MKSRHVATKLKTASDREVVFKLDSNETESFLGGFKTR